MSKSIKNIQLLIDNFLQNKQFVKVLDAGCGKRTILNFSKNAFIVGIDISKKQLERNNVVNEKILGDIQTINLLREEFDIIICWQVLEHLPKPERALMNFSRAIKKEGIIILALPNIYSLSGLITKYTPFQFHIWFKRRILKRQRATLDTFPTFLKPTISMTFIKKFSCSHQFSIEHLEIYENETGAQKILKEKYKLVAIFFRALEEITKFISLGRSKFFLGACLVVLKKVNDGNIFEGESIN